VPGGTSEDRVTPVCRQTTHIANIRNTLDNSNTCIHAFEDNLRQQIHKFLIVDASFRRHVPILQ